MNGENIDRKYSIITNDIIQKYNILGNFNLDVEIDNINTIQGKIILLKQGKDIINTIKIASNEITLANIPVGTYFLQMPIVTGYSQEYAYVQVKEDMEY